MDEPTALLPPSLTLDELLRSKGAPTLERGLRLLAAIAGAMVSAQESNGPQGRLSSREIRVSALDADEPHVALAPSDGTLEMSPGSESYGLGVIAFEVLAGRPPKRDEALVDALPDVPAAVDRLVSKLISKMTEERPSLSAAHRQFTELAEQFGEASVRAASPLSSPPHIKRGPPIGKLRTDQHEWVRPTALEAPPDDSDGTQVMKPAAAATNPFAEDEPTATVRGPVSSELGDDYPTQYTRKQESSSNAARRPPPLAPPVPTPLASEQVTADPDAPFEAAKADLVGRTDSLGREVKAAPKRVTRVKAATPLEQLVALATRQPPWIWGAIGVGLAFFVLLLIGLAR